VSWADLEACVFDELAATIAATGAAALPGFGDFTVRGAVNYVGAVGAEQLLFFKASDALIKLVAGARPTRPRIAAGDLVARVSERTQIALRDVDAAVQQAFSTIADRLCEHRSAAPLPGIGVVFVRVRHDVDRWGVTETAESWRHGEHVTFAFRAAGALREAINGRPAPLVADPDRVADLLRAHPPSPVMDADDLLERAMRLPVLQQVVDRTPDQVLSQAGFVPPRISALLALRTVGRPVLDAIVDAPNLYSAREACLAHTEATPFAYDHDGWWAYCACAPEREDPWVFSARADRRGGHRHILRLGQWLAARLMLAELATIPGTLSPDTLSGVLGWVDRVAPCSPELLDGIAA
jgi:nucleoid DNA-binding protein